MEDTVTRAKQEREKQGTWEVEVSYGGEADLHQHLKGCDKNPGHHKFVPVDQFNVDHLPPGCHDNDLVDLVRAMSDLTVRVSVKYVSDRRPKIDPMTGGPYANYRNMASDIIRFGTGWVYFVDRYDYSNDNKNTCACMECLESLTPRTCNCQFCLEFDTPKTCECHECLNSPTPKTRFAHIVMVTAVHVVYDDLEGAQTTCHLFFNSGNTPDECTDSVALRGGMFRVRTFDDRDWCEMTFVTHDMDLADKLTKMSEEWERIKIHIQDKYEHILSESKTPSARPVPDDMKTLTLIVSHPHGCSKQVSVGNYTRREVKARTKSLHDNCEIACYRYTTPSCPGSSGAPVFVLGRSWWGLYDTSVHSGGGLVSTNDQLNYSCFGSEFVSL